MTVVKYTAETFHFVVPVGARGTGVLKCRLARKERMVMVKHDGRVHRCYVCWRIVTFYFLSCLYKFSDPYPGNLSHKRWKI